MTELAVHVQRPYASEEEYLDAEAWTIDARGMLLVDQPELEIGSIVQFDVSLSRGQRIMRGEARVTAYMAPTEDRVGAVRIRFRKYAQQTKAFIDRALAARERQLAELESEPAPPLPAEPTAAEPTAAEPTAAEPLVPAKPPAAVPHLPSAAEPSVERAQELVATPAATGASKAASSAVVDAPGPLEAAPADVCRPAYSEPIEPSGIHRRPAPYAPPVPAPENREELLARLRSRAQRKREEQALLEEERRGQASRLQSS